MHLQTEFLQKWEEMGFNLDPTPRAPLVEFEKTEWTEAKIFEAVFKEVEQIADEGFEGIMIGRLSNEMCYAWHIAYEMGMVVVMAKTPRKRTPDGKFIFELAGWTELFSPSFCRSYYNKKAFGKDVYH